jgi:hypothetical protein
MDQADPLADLAGGSDGCALHLPAHKHGKVHGGAGLLASPILDPYHLTDPDPALDDVQPADRGVL